MPSEPTREVHEDPYPSRTAMEAAVELEIHSALGRVQTATIGKVIQRAIDKALTAQARMHTDYIDIVFDGPPSHESGRFVEVEDENGKSINAGEWIDRGNGLWALRIARTLAENRRGRNESC